MNSATLSQNLLANRRARQEAIYPPCLIFSRPNDREESICPPKRGHVSRRDQKQGGRDGGGDGELDSPVEKSRQWGIQRLTTTMATRYSV
jgi:hypothetical protein